MTELDEVWADMMSTAAGRARAEGRHDVADYLSLKAANDAIRSAGVKWLFDSVTEIVSEVNRSHLGIVVERTEPHNFPHQGANLVGSQLRISQGVRCLTVEAGWTRTPSDGFMRGGSLAVAKLRHFGIPRANADLALTMSAGSPAWSILNAPGPKNSFSSDDLRDHFRILLAQ